MPCSVRHTTMVCVEKNISRYFSLIYIKNNQIIINYFKVKKRDHITHLFTEINSFHLEINTEHLKTS